MSQPNRSITCIPTRRKERLPPGFDYPLWPTAITEAMRETPQLAEMELIFRWRDEFHQRHWLERLMNGGEVVLIEAEYKRHHSPYFPKWKIIVNSVPNEHLDAVRNQLIDGALADFARRIANYPVTPGYSVHEQTSYRPPLPHTPSVLETHTATP